jgi:signal transduction histidine kinase
MNMLLKRVVIAVVLCLFVAVPAFAQKTTPEQAKKLVEQASAYMKANGEEKAIKEFSDPKGQFTKGDAYIFVLGLDGVLRANVARPELVGKNVLNSPDSKGKFHRKEMVELANSKGSGWVEYNQLNPATKQDEPKISYIQKVGNVLIGCGAYK